MSKTEKKEVHLAILLDNYSFVLLHSSDKGKNWANITSQKHDVKKLKFLDDNDTELSSSDYKVKLVDLSYQYTFNSGVKCKKIKLGEEDVWKHSDDPKFSTITMFHLGLISNNFFVKNSSEFKKLELKSTQAKPAGTTPIIKPSITPVTLDISKTKGTNEFGYSKEDKIYTFTAKDGFKFNKVTKGTDSVWESKDNVCGTKVIFIDEKDKYVSILLTNNMFTLFHLEGNEWKDITSDRHDVTKLKFFGEGDTEITSSDYSVTIVDYSYRYTFNSGVNCKKIMYADVDVWKPSDDPKFSTITAFDLGLVSNNFFVKNQSEFKKLDFKPTQPKATPVTKPAETKSVEAKIAPLTSSVSPPKGTPVGVDINTNQSTNDFEYTDENGVVTYKPKDNHVINKLVQGTTDIWQSKNDIFGTLVRIKVTKNVKYLAILLDNHMFILFHLENNEWKDITKDRYDVSKLKFFVEGDVEISKTHYSVNIFFLSYEITFNSDVKCKKIMLAHDDVWKDTDDTNYSDIKSFSLGLTSNAFFVKNQSDKSKKLDFTPTPVKTPTKVTVDIEKTQSNNELDYTDENGVVTFKPKDNHVFIKVSQGTTDIWEAKNDINGTLVRTKISKGVKFLVVLLTNNMFTLFHEEAGKWQDVTSKRHDVTKIKFFGEGDVELKSSDYTVTIVDLSFAYLFNDGVKCKKIKLGDDELWKHTDDTNFAEIKSFSLGLASNSFFAKNQSDQLKKIEKALESDAEPKVTPTIVSQVSTPLTSVAKPAVTHVSADISKTESTNDFEYTDESGVITYTPKSGNVFSKVSQGTTDVWQSTNDVFGTLVRIKVTKNVKYLAILLDNHMFILFHLENNEWKDITKDRYDVSKLKFFVEGDVEISKTHYSVNIVFLSYEITFNSDVKCKKIMLAHDDVWKHTDDTKYSDIKSFSLGLTSNTFFVKNQSDQSKKLEFKPTQAKEGQVTKGQSEVITSTTVQLTSLAIIAEPPPEKASVTVISPTGKPRPKKTPELAAVNRRAVTVNIREKANSDTVDFNEDYLKNVMVFSAKEKFVFNKIVEIDDYETVIWVAKNKSEHFDRVYVDGLGTFSSTKNLSIHLCNGTFKHFNKSGSEGWSESPGIADLDLRISNSNIKVDYFQKDNYRIYVAKPGYTIRKVIKSKKCSSDCCCSPKVIWEAQSEHALKVVLMGSKKEPKHLAVLLKSGELTLLFKSGKGEPWEDITSSKNKITDLKMYAVAEGGKSVELHRGHYSITLFNEFYGYVFYEGVGCHLVKYKGKNIWDLREERDFGNLKGVFLDLKSNKFNVMNDDDRCWVCEEVRKVNPVTLDISSKASTDDFDFTVDHNRNINIYTSKGNAMFYRVVKRSSTTCCWSTCCDSEVVIWEANDPKKYASKVFADGVGACSSTKNVSIYLLSGDILHFGKGGRNEPWKKSSHKIILDVDKTSSTIGYDFVHEGESRTFTAKPGYQFATVFLKGTGILYNIFLEARTYEESSTKVTVYGVETTVKNINIFLNNNQIKHFHKVDGKWVSKTSIVLDIEKNKDNDLFEYRSTRNFGHFNPKPNLTITKIVKTYKSNCCVSTCCGSTCCGSIDEHEIWTAQPEDHGLKAVLMGSGKDEKFLSILLQSGNFVLLRKCGKGECWEDITQEKSDFSDIKMYSLEEGTSKYHLLTGNDYDPIIFESRYGYEFKDSVKCVKITYNDNLLWSHTDDAEFGYLKGLYLDLPKDQFSVTNLKDQTKQLTKAKVAKVTLDIEKTVSTNDFEHSESRNFHKYKPKLFRVFSKVVQGTTDIWVSKDGMFGTSVGVRTKDDQKYVAVLLENGRFSLFQESGGNWTDITSSRFDVTKLKFYSPSDHELTSSNYTVELLGHCKCFTISYIFDRGPKCKSVMYGNDIVWDENSCSTYKTIKRFDFNPVSNIFYAVKNCCDWKKINYEPAPTQPKATPVTKPAETKSVEAKIAPLTSSVSPPKGTPVGVDINTNQSTNDFEYTDENGVVTYKPKDNHVINKLVQGTTDIWQSKNDIFGTLVRIKVTKNVKYLAILLDNHMFILFHLENNEWKDITKDRYDVSKLKFFVEGDVEISKTHYSVNIFFLSYEITFNSDVKCKKIMLAHDDVWKDTDDTNYSDIKSFSLGLTSNAFFVKNQSDKSKKLDFTPTPVKTPTKVTVDIEKTQSNNELDYTDENGVVTFKPKDNHVFIKVSQGTTDIWEAKNDINGTLVRTKISKGVKFLVVLLTNNMFTLFHEEAGKWQDVTSKRHDVTKIKFFGEGDVELSKSSDYTVTIVDLSFAYLFNDGVKCKKIKLGDDELWKHTDDTNFAEIKSFSLGLASNSFFAKNQSDQLKKIEKALESDAEPKVTPISAPVTKEEAESKVKETKTVQTKTVPLASAAKPAVTPVTADISKTQSTNDFEYTDESGVVTYTPKSGNAFNKVSQGTKVVWESSDNVYGTLVRIKVTKGIKYLAILLDNHMFILFHLENNEWKDITKDRYDVSKLKLFGENEAELKSSDYSVNIVFLSYEITFNCDVKCKKIMLAHDDVWKDTDDANYSDIKSFSLGLSSNTFFVKNQSDQSKKLEFTPTQAKATPVTSGKSEPVEAMVTPKSAPLTSSSTTPKATLSTGTKTPAVTPVAVDVSMTQSTDKLDYSKDGDFHKYTPKDNHAFNKVVDGTTNIWESKDNIHSKLVRSKTKEDGKYLAILLTDNSLKLFKQDSGKNKPWVDITSQRHDLMKLKFLGDNDAEIKSTDYTVTLVDYSYEFKFNAGIKCKKVKLGDDDVWKHTDDTKFSEITKFQLGLISNSFFVVNKSESKKLEFTPTQVKGAPVTTPTKVSVDVDKTQSTNEFQYSKDASEFVTYTPKDNQVFNKVTKKNTVIWESKDNIHGTLVMSKTEKKEVHLAILLDNYSFVLLHSSDKGKNWANITSQKHDVKKLKFLDDNDTELSSSDYKVKLVDLSYQYTFNSGVKCKKIKLGEEDVWKHSDDPKFSTITMFHLGLISNNFFVKNSSEFKKLELKSTQAKPAGTKAQAKPAESAKAAPTTPAAKSEVKTTPDAKPTAKPTGTQSQAKPQAKSAGQAKPPAK
uniref:SfiI-subtelomeric related protein family member, putative n=1 Tax=Theileria annulata TaxID=5874 RepID=A0A3B0MYG3_THEAN